MACCVAKSDGGVRARGLSDRLRGRAGRGGELAVTQATRASVNGRCGTRRGLPARLAEQFARRASGGGMTVEAPRVASWRSCWR